MSLSPRSPLARRLRAGVPLARYTAARLGGPAEWLYSARASRAELVDVFRQAREAELPLRVLGGGANVLIADAGLRGLVLINHVQEREFGDAWLRASAGSGLMALARSCQARGLAGLEWAVSVPGTLGGAVINNAGAHGGDMASLLQEALLLDSDGRLRQLSAVELAYDYRHSSLKVRADRDWLLLEATLALQPDDPARIAARMATFSEARKRSQPLGASLGSIFRNPPGDFAGRLIEASGLKSCRCGAAQVSTLHANFFINPGNATTDDYRRLVVHVQEVVLREQNVRLEPEIELLGAAW